MKPVFEVFRVFLRLGLTCFGGPTAHIAYFREEFAGKGKWLSDAEFASTLALCQFLPGPASSQLGFAIGLMRAGVFGAFAAWIAFTLPSAALMTGFALGVVYLAPEGDPGWLQGLRVAVVVVVARAVWSMAQTLCPDRARLSLAFAAAIAMLALPVAWAQIVVIGLGGLLGWFLYRGAALSPTAESAPPVRAVPGSLSTSCLVLFFVLLIGIPLAVRAFDLEKLGFAYGFYQSGALVFGGGHVVLPLLREFVVPQGWMSDETFMAGYGAAQALPGPLFTIAAYLGTVAQGPLTGVAGGLVALLAVFLPSWLLILGALPHWQRLSRNRHASAALQGANAAVVGLLLAALYDPVWTRGILSVDHVLIALGLFALLAIWKLPPWAGVLLAAAAGYLLL